MEDKWFYFLPASLFLFLLSMFISIKKSWYKCLPPSPPSLPIIGHLHLLKEPIHRTLQNLSAKYGPILFLKYGSRNVLVVSSPSLVEECFNKNDLVFANRPKLLAAKILNYNCTAMSVTNYGQHWRNLRRLAAVEILSTNRLNMYRSIRQQEVRFMIKNLFDISRTSFSKVEMKTRLSELSFNIIMEMITGKRYFGADGESFAETERFRDDIWEVFEVSGASNLADFLPLPRWFDFQGLKKRMVKLQKRCDGFLQALIEEQRNKKKVLCPQGEESTKTFIEVMLSLQESEPELHTDEITKGMIMTMLIAATDTSAVTIEWAMSLLLNHPEALKKAREELDNYIGQDRLVDEQDCPKLPYLQSIINETFRMYPAAPLLVPHESSDNCTIGGYHVPRGTILLVNAWAIHRDPKVWEDPTSFRPERFAGVIAEAYQLMPFGLGRRSCPGAGLANRVVAFALAALIQCFEWEKIGQEELDMSEGGGLTMPKSRPLEAMCKARESMVNILAEL